VVVVLGPHYLVSQYRIGDSLVILLKTTLKYNKDDSKDRTREIP